MYTRQEQYDWANEYIVLLESAEELIVLHRNVMRNEEFVLLIGKSSSADGVHQNEYLLDFSEYEKLLRHELKIRSYHKRQDNFKLFHAFFGQTMTEFFKSIVSF